MMRTIGFLAGVCLTVAVFLLVRNTSEYQQRGIAPTTITDPTQEQLSAMVAAIAEQVDIVQAGIKPDEQVPLAPEPGPADAGTKRSFAAVAGGSVAEETSAVPMTIVAQADDPKAGQEPDITAPTDQLSAATDIPLQEDFETSGMEFEQLPIDPAADNELNAEDRNATNTYLFWSPFHSTWAADGFAGRLTLATQVPVDVINTGPGKYRVAFTYQDETERLARIERIETITGLKLE
jgi:hypothetical protein